MRAAFAILVVLAITPAASIAVADIGPSSDPGCERREADAPCVASDGSPGKCESRSGPRGNQLWCIPLRGSATATKSPAPLPASATEASGCSTAGAPSPAILLGLAGGALAINLARRRRR